MTDRHPTADAGTDAVFGAVAYADVFDMPIERRHLDRFVIGQAMTRSEIDAALKHLVSIGELCVVDELAHLPGRAEVLATYADRSARARTMWRAAEIWGRRIGHMPFVEMVAVTGGLAVDSVADHDDIDYFIITRPGRLWLTRLMIIALGKLAARSDIELCPNYIVATDSLDMSPRNVYVARELAQMVPIINAAACGGLRRQNAWMFDHLPNATLDGDVSHVQTDSRVLKQVSAVAERVLSLSMFASVERWEMDRKIHKLTTVSSRRPEVGTPDESDFSPQVCKGHIVGNAGPIDAAWRQRLAPREHTIA